MPTPILDEVKKLTADPHAGMPIIGAPNGANNVASVAFVPSAVKSDRAMRIRITASGGGGINAAVDVVTITFASEWKDTNGNPVTLSLIHIWLKQIKIALPDYRVLVIGAERYICLLYTSRCV